MGAKKKAAPKKRSAVSQLKDHDVYQLHMVLGLELLGQDKMSLRCVEPGVSGAPVGYMTVPREFGQKLCPGMVLKTTLSIVGMYQRKK